MIPVDVIQGSCSQLLRNSHERVGTSGNHYDLRHVKMELAA